jgi:hypothetical protein
MVSLLIWGQDIMEVQFFSHRPHGNITQKDRVTGF